MTMNTPRSRRTLTIKEKVEIISKLKNGINNFILCKQYKVGHSTISTIWKKRDEILECFETKSSKLKRNRKARHQEVENALLVWLKAQRSQNLPLSRTLLQEKANHFAILLGKIDFECSMSWVQRFCHRHDIVVGKDCGEANANWLNTVYPILTKDYTENEIWNLDETGLFFNMTPEKALKFKGEKCEDGKLAKDRITLVVATSMSGEKRKLLVISNAKNPDYFRNVKSLPVEYEANKTAWMTSEIFEKLLCTWDSELRSKNKEIILFVNNCAVHPKIENLTNIKLAFLPPNATSVILPINRGIINTFKSNYRKCLVQKMIANTEITDGPFLVNLFDAIEMVTTAWARVTSNTIIKCFQQAGFSKSSLILKTEDDSDNEWDSLLEQLAHTKGTSIADWETYVNIDSQLVTASNLSDSEIIESVISSHHTKHDEKIEVKEEKCMEIDVPTTKDVLCAVSQLKRYCLFGDGKDIIDIEGVMQIEHILEKRLAQEKRSKHSSDIKFIKCE